MTRGVTAKVQRQDRLRLRRKQLQDAAQALAGAKSPPIPIPHKYPVKKASLGDRQSVKPIGRADK